MSVLIAALIVPSAYAQKSSSIHGERRSEDYAQAEFDRKQKFLDRNEIVRPAPKKFRPSAVAHNIKLKLSLEMKKVRLGEPLRYRLEIVNLGSEPYNYVEGPSFFKSGRLPHDRISLILREPDGSTVAIRSPIGTAPDIGGDEIRFPPGTSESQKEEKFNLMRRGANASSRLFVTLAPGESLRTRGDGPKDGFRRLLMRDKIELPGTYELHAELDGLFNPGLPSNTVRFTVAP